ncbi:hypothetical protein G9A89_014179 [Geosiphon pyriformis]|nr:hypothetical protein G9A89_014179 [Geosiphon pyriformis]
MGFYSICPLCGLNTGPLDLQSNALPTELRRRVSLGRTKKFFIVPSLLIIIIIIIIIIIMSSKPIVAVSGATGQQGGSVVNALLATGKYNVRGLTRDPSSAAGKALAAKGVEVVKANLSNSEDVERAFKGADVAWIVTNFWDPSIVGTDVGEEVRQGKLVADAAKKVGLNWLIYSSLPDPAAGSKGLYNNVIHFTGKNQVEEYIRQSGIPNSTFVYAGFYSSNIGAFFPLIDKEGYAEIRVPIFQADSLIPIFDASNDTGPIVAKIIEEGPQKWNGKRVAAAAEYISFQKIAETLTKVRGKEHRFISLSKEETAKEFPYLANEEIFEMNGWIKDFGYFGEDAALSDLSIAKELHPSIATFEQYAQKKYGKN